MLRHHRLAILTLCLWYALLGILFFLVRPELAYSYGHWTVPFAGNLPHLTAVLSLPVLGPSFSTPDQGYSPLFWLAWGALFLCPLLPLRVFWRASNVSEQLAGLSHALIYLLLATLLGTMVAFGLWLPFSAA